MRILVPVDMTVESAPLVRYAAGLSAHLEGDLLILHVYSQRDVSTALREEGLVVDLYVGRLRSELNYLKAQAGAAGQKARIEVVLGDPAEMILKRASELPSDLIVMGTHRRTGLERLMLGSVAEAVLRRAPCPVVLMPVSILAGRPRERTTADVS